MNLSDNTEMKACSKCHIEKPLSEYYNCKKRPDGKRGICKTCWSESSQEYRESHKEELIEKQKQYRDDNKVEISERRRNQYPNHRDRVKKYQDKTKAHNKEVKKIYREENKDILSAKFRQWADENRDTYLARRRGKRKQRMESDPQFRLNRSFSQRIRESLKTGKNGAPWESLVGYALSDLKTHIEKHFLAGMMWDNYGEWQIDHRTPLAVHCYGKPADIDFQKAWELKNLQPMWAQDNMSKGAKLDKPFQPSLAIAI